MKLKIKVPEISDIRLSQFQKFIRTTEGSEDINFINKQLVGIFCDLPDNVVNNMTKRSFDSVVADLNKVLDIKDKCELKRIITHNGRQYGFIPNLDEITVGEQADIEMYISDWQKMDKAMAVLYRPVKTKIKDKYLIEDYDTESEKFEPSLDLTMDVVFGAYFFFVNLTKDLLTYTPSYIQHLVQQNNELLSSDVSGDGIKKSMDYLKETFLNLKMSLN